MIGIVLWSDPASRKAVFWCEDQGDLAYFEDSEDGPDFFDAGDMVRFEVTTERRLRRAHAPTIVQPRVCTDLPEKLRRNGEPERTTARIIPFTPREERTPVRPWTKRKA